MTHATRRPDGRPYWLLPLGAVLAALLLVGSTPTSLLAGSAPSQTVAVNDLRQQAQTHEKTGDWLEACRLYDEMIRKDRTSVEAREGYHRCVRQYLIGRRHSDRVYRDALKSLDPAAALDIYEAVLKKISTTYVDPKKTEINALVKHGVQEVRYALNQTVFVREYLAGAAPGALEAFKKYLAGWPERKIGNPSEVRNLILTLASKAKQEDLVEDKSTFAVVLALEFAFGACTGLDEYTLFLTPQHYNAVQAALTGKFVGVGIDLALVDRDLVITRIYPKSPAEQSPLHVGDRIVRIDQQAVESLAPEVAAELLRGAPDSVVELEVVTPGQVMSTLCKLQRRPVMVPSVETPYLDDDYIGYIRITHFQESTLREVQEALAVLQTKGMKSLILDLRGNPGGSFLPAVKVAELFLPDGVIVNTTSQYEELNKPYRVKNNLNPLTTPLCVLIDAETASSAELLAGALQENGRAQLCGQTTFGKGSIQCIIPLKTTPGGIRITVAKFTSPRKNPYTNVGVRPDLLTPLDADPEAVINQAKAHLKMLMMMSRADNM